MKHNPRLNLLKVCLTRNHKSNKSVQEMREPVKNVLDILVCGVDHIYFKEYIRFFKAQCASQNITGDSLPRKIVYF